MSRFDGWRLLAALWIITVFNFGFTAYAPAVINSAMTRALGLSHEALGDLFALYMLMSGLPGPLVALGIDRMGSYRTMALGSALIVCGSVLLATVVSGSKGALLSFGVLVGAGSITGALLPAQSVLARKFIRNRSLVLAALYSGVAVGGFVAAPLANHLIQAYGNWRAGWWLIVATSSVAGCLALALVGTVSPEDRAGASRTDVLSRESRPTADRQRGFTTRREWSYRQAVMRPTFWLILCSFLGTSSGNTVFLAHGVMHLQSLGHPAAFAAWSIGTMTASGLAGKALLATLGDRFDPRFLLVGFLLAYSAGLVLIVNADAESQALLSVACLGVGFGGGYVCLMTVVSNYYGVTAFPALAGTVTAIPTAFSALASSVAGRLFDAGWGYAVTFYALAGWSFAGSVVLLFIRPPNLPDRSND